MLPVAVLAGGLATRLHPLTQTLPKSMVPIGGEPFVFHQLRLLHRAGIRHVVFCLGHLGEQVAACVGDGASMGMRVDYSFDGPRLLGTAGALKIATPLLGEEFFVLYGDAYLRCDYAAVEQRYRQSKKPALMTVFNNEDRWDTSNVEFRAGQIVSYSKSSRTPRMRYIDYGLGVLSATALSDVPVGRPTDLAGVYERLAESANLAAFEVNQRFFEVGSFAGLKEFEIYLEKERPA